MQTPLAFVAGTEHAEAAAQASTDGKAISSLTVIDGRIYAGYGDELHNTGPINLESLDATDPTGAWTNHLTAETEQVGVYRALADGRILVPHVDPRAFGVGGYSERSSGGIWTDKPQQIALTGIVHVYDLVEFAGDLWACGSDNGGAAVWRSTDAGVTWAQSLVGPRGDSAYFNGLAVGNGTLYVTDLGSGRASAWDGSAWTDVSSGGLFPSLGSLARIGPGKPWRDGTVFFNWTAEGAANRQVLYLDGVTPWTIVATSAHGFDVGDDGALYVLAGTSIYRAPASGAMTLTYLGDVPAGGSALCVLPGSTQILVGTSTAGVLLVDLP